MSEYPTDFERLEVAEAEVERLTAELAEADKLLRVHEATDDARLAAAEAREKKLRAITDLMRDAFQVSHIKDEWCDEWNNRAERIV